GDGYKLYLVGRDGISEEETASIVLATGCRERTARQVFIQGTRPAGIFTAGTAQNFVNLQGKMPTKRCVILGSGDIGLIMARRLTLEGAEVEGVYEVKSTPSGLTRNLHQCLKDFNIPLHLSTTVTRVFGEDRLSAVEVAEVDDKMRPIAGTERIIECDALILSVGLIPENELAETLAAALDKKTKGPLVDQTFMTTAEGIFSAGNALHVNDLVDYVTESARLAGGFAAEYRPSERKLVEIKADKNFLYVVPQYIDLNKDITKTVVYFRSASDMSGRFSIELGGQEVFSKKYRALRPPEMERLELDFEKLGLKRDEPQNVEFKLEVIK
ncbi:MAG TPA: FAD-dependent oxidoreductase, partial [Eubacteriales bacterium]|nr:FAD-dependent oxidoreductase [Eubacteriales bacterium]